MALKSVSTVATSHTSPTDAQDTHLHRPRLIGALALHQLDLILSVVGVVYKHYNPQCFVE